MNKIAIDRVVQKRFREAGKHFRQLKYHASVDPVHDFRVEIKKLRAILRLLSMADHVAIKIPSKLKKIYSKAGIIRELQVLQIRNKKEKALTDFSIKQIRNTQKKETSALNELARSHSIAADKKEVVALLPKNIAFRTVINFFSTKLAEINRLLYLKRITDEVMHSIRKILKDLLYVAQLLEKEMHFRFPNSVWNKSKETWYLQISSALGDYHDYSVEQSFRLKHGLKRNTSAYNFKKNILASLRKNIFEPDPELLYPQPIFKKAKKQGFVFYDPV